MMDPAGRELIERRLDHTSLEPRAFYRVLKGRVSAGIEGTGTIRRFERFLPELVHEL